MTETAPVLYYVHDPMCSWCWGFRPVWEQVQLALKGIVNIQYVLGGLAADTDKPMPENMQSRLRDNWQRIQQEIPGTEFNFDFWSVCKPRRSTYPACRAVIASKIQQPESEKKMILAIQQAYYLDAKNPSDVNVLIQLADDIGLNIDTFASDMNSNACQHLLESELLLTRDLYVSSFPSLVLSRNHSDTAIQIDYINSDCIVRQILSKLNSVDSCYT